MEQRALQRFESTIKSNFTRKNYKRDLDYFLKFYHKDSESILSIPDEKIQEMIEDYVLHLKNTTHSSTAISLFWGIKHFFLVNRKKIDWELIYKMLPQRQVKSGTKPWTTKQIQTLLTVAKSKRNKAFIHFLASTGCRIGIFDHDLTMKRLVDVGHGCKAVYFYAGYSDEYFSFLTPEASSFLGDYHQERKNNGEIFDDDTPIFRLTYQLGSTPAKQMNSACAKKITNRILNTSDIQRRKQGFASETQINHGFRKRFNTILKVAGVNYSIAEKLMGHKTGLDSVYFKPTVEECFNEFRKAIPELSIDDAIRLEEEIKNKDDQIHDLETDKDRRITNLEVMISELAKRLDSKIDS